MRTRFPCRVAVFCQQCCCVRASIYYLDPQPIFSRRALFFPIGTCGRTLAVERSLRCATVKQVWDFTKSDSGDKDSAVEEWWEMLAGSNHRTGNDCFGACDPADVGPFWVNAFAPPHTTRLVFFAHSPVVDQSMLAAAVIFWMCSVVSSQCRDTIVGRPVNV